MIRLLFIIGTCFLLMNPGNAHGQNALFSEYQIKIAYLFNFAKFVDWPEDAFANSDSPFVLGILGDDPFGSAIDAVKGKTVNGRKLLTNYYKDVRDISACQILFISSSESENLLPILRFLRHSKILVVGDTEGFAEQGGVVNFITQNNKVSFEINIDAANRAGLKISSKLLSLAKIVHDRGQ
jgi:hypothetical protein